MKLDNYECDGQMDIFDYLKKPKAETTLCAGDWVEEHGPRIKFDDIQENHYYIADYSTVGHKWYKVVYVKWVKDGSVGYVDSEKGVKGKWSWGNNHSALTRKAYIDSDDTFGWWYEVQKPIPVDIRGICDDAYCPKCGYEFVTWSDKSEVDCKRCPKCNIRIDWTRYHRVND